MFISVIEEIFGHYQLSSQCLQVQPVMCWHPPVLLYWIGVYSVNSSKTIRLFLQSWTPSSYFSNLTGSFVTNCRISPIIGSYISQIFHDMWRMRCSAGWLSVFSFGRLLGNVSAQLVTVGSINVCLQRHPSINLSISKIRMPDSKVRPSTSPNIIPNPPMRTECAKMKSLSRESFRQGIITPSESSIFELKNFDQSLWL